MTEYIKREDAMDAVLDVYYNTPDIDLNGEQHEAARAYGLTVIYEDGYNM